MTEFEPQVSQLESMLGSGQVPFRPPFRSARASPGFTEPAATLWSSHGAYYAQLAEVRTLLEDLAADLSDEIGD